MGVSMTWINKIKGSSRGLNIFFYIYFFWKTVTEDYIEISNARKRYSNLKSVHAPWHGLQREQKKETETSSSPTKAFLSV